MRTVNFGIDLGTTNSLIAAYNNGVHEVFKNPLGHKQTLSSAVAFRGEKIIVGDKARDLLEKDPLNVFTSFKRKMGTTDRYFVERLQKDVSPIDLSAYVLKELQNFIHTGEVCNEVVITIPSSFDTIQSNATKVAGTQAGFKNVFLLQEPIAASLAFANKNNLTLETNKKWLIYDFGGGTFDVALLEIDQRAMNVLDNEGDNFLGGMDIDNLIIEKLIVPKLEAQLNETKLWEQFKAPNNPYQKLYYELLFKAEEAKKELSVYDVTEIDIDITDKDIFTTIEITKSDFNVLLAPLVDHTIQFAKQILVANNLVATDIEKVIMVGGTTLIPFVREQVEKELQIPIDTSVDPTAAVGIGAAYYAGSKPATIEETVKENSSNTNTTIKCDVFYEKNSKDNEELIAVTFQDELKGSYRITRKDGGYDTGIVALNGPINTFVDLNMGELNSFELKIYDTTETLVYSTDIHINQGKYDIKGQLLPNDICLEIDDLEHNSTRLDAIFTKNSVLPLKKTLYKTASKTILTDSEIKLQINIVEGNNNGLPSSGLSIGYIEISGKDLEEDLIKGTDIEIDISVSESRDITVNVFLTASEQEFNNTFKPTERYISSAKMAQEMRSIVDKIEQEQQKEPENYELLSKYKKIREELIELQIELSLLSEDDVTDSKFKIDNKKRQLIQGFDKLTRHKILNEIIEEYQSHVNHLKLLLANDKSDYLEGELSKIRKNETSIINSGNIYLIKGKTQDLKNLQNNLFNADDSNYISPFLHLKNMEYEQQHLADNFITDGQRALDAQQYKVLKQVVFQLMNLLPDEEKPQFNDSDKTGLR